MAFDKLKKLADQAKDRAVPLLADAKEKAGPLAAQAKDKAGELATKAAPIAAQGLDKASAGLDKATKGKYTDKITGVHNKVNGGLSSVSQPGKTDKDLIDEVPPVVIDGTPISTEKLPD